MVIMWEGEENFRISSKAASVKIGKSNRLGKLEISEPGEYEVSGVQMEIIDGIIEVYAEGMTVGHIKKGKILTDDELQKLNGIDILLIGVGGGAYSETKTATDVINQIEPSIVIPMYHDNLDEFVKEGNKESAQDQLKISKIDLPSEERQIVVLKPSIS